jgi:hypothetical protein
MQIRIKLQQACTIHRDNSLEKSNSETATYEI